MNELHDVAVLMPAFNGQALRGYQSLVTELARARFSTTK